MDVKIAENIRIQRKAKKMTQEELAEAMGVTVGAVSKWETGISAPDIGLVMDLADFFEISIDVLLGYQMHSKSRETFLTELKSYIHNKSKEVPFKELEKGLKRFPNDFDVVCRCAAVYELRGTESRDPGYNHRALALYETACGLLDQNTDPDISLTLLRVRMAGIYRSLGEQEKAVEILKENNPCGVNNALIGQILATSDKVEEAVPYLSMGMLDMISNQFSLADGFLNVYGKRGEYEQMVEVLHWVEQVLTVSRRPDEVCYMDKFLPGYIAIRGHGYLKLGQSEMARKELEKAWNLARRFDAAPTYKANQIRFVQLNNATAYDDFGSTAMEGIDRILAEQEDPKLCDLWEEVKHNG